MADILTLKDISKTFRDEEKKDLKVLSGISFSVAEKEFITVLGPSGSGKSTLLRIIAGLIRPDHGEVLIHGKPPVPEEPQDAFVFQNFALLPYLTVRENIEFGLNMFGTPKQKRASIVKGLIEEMGLQGFEKNYPRELSGGMKQRVGIARALAVDPNILLMDEPFSSLDETTAEKLRKEILSLSKKFGKTVVMVTHRVEEAIEMSDRIIVLTSRPSQVGGIIENSLPRPVDKRSKAFFDLEDAILKIME